MNMHNKAIKALDDLLEYENAPEKSIYYIYQKAQLYKRLKKVSLYKGELKRILKYSGQGENKFYKRAQQELRNE